MNEPRPVDQKAIKKNVEMWQRQRKRRSAAIAEKASARRFNSMADKIPEWKPQ